MTNNASMRNIAEAAGVSKATVSRVINGRPAGIRVSSATRDRILSLVRQFGYQPTRFVRDVAFRSQAAVGLILAPGGPDASTAHLPAIDSVLAANGRRLLLAVLPVDPAIARERVTALLRDGVSGFLCAPAAMPVVVQIVAGTCPVVVMGPVAGETILRALGVDIPVPAIQPAPVVSPPVIQPVPVAPPPVTQPPPSVEAAACPPEPERRPVTGGTVPEPILPVIPVTPAPSPVAEPKPVVKSPPEPVVIESPFVAPVTELDVADQAPGPAPDPQPLPDLVVSEPASVPEPNPVPAPEPAPVIPVTQVLTPVVEPEQVISEPIIPVVESVPEPASDTPAGVPASAGVPNEPIPVSESASPVAEPIPPAPEPEPAQEPVPAPAAPIEFPPLVAPAPVPEPQPPPVEPVTTPVPIIDPVPEPLPSEPEPVVEVSVVVPVNPEPKGEVAVPEEEGTGQPDQSIPSSPPEKASE